MKNMKFPSINPTKLSWKNMILIREILNANSPSLFSLVGKSENVAFSFWLPTSKLEKQN